MAGFEPPIHPPRGQSCCDLIAEFRWIETLFLTPAEQDGTGIDRPVEGEGRPIARLRARAVRLDMGGVAGEGEPLLDLRVPSYNFDVIAGLTYEIDLLQPARTDINGRIISEQAHRIVDLRYQGQPVDPQRDFLVVTNNYRAGGGGRFPAIDGNAIALNDATANRDILISFIRKSGHVAVMEQPPWQFLKPKSPIRVWFDSAPNAIKFTSEVQDLRNIGEGRTGYTRFELQIG
jgi:2',3'-cyclic-nucleotide 2'-phosphodiesterase/3'-nucleotidase